MPAFSKPRKVRVLLPLLLSLLFVAACLPPRGFAAPSGQDAASEPDVTARAAIVVEYPTGRVLYNKAMHDRLAPASTTKILTTILALEYGKLDDRFTVTTDDIVGESSMGLKTGETPTLRDLVYGMMLPSGNDAAMVTARGLASKAGPAEGMPTDPIERFAGMMNTRVNQLGLKDSHFITPHGLDHDGHYSSAYDLASLSWYALHFPFFNEVVKQVSYEAPGHPLLNTNEMLTRYMGADGIKTGWTDAGGLCLVTSATRDGYRLISVVLNAPRWYADTTALLNYGFAKLGAAPSDTSAEVLEVSKRGTTDWLLQNGAPPPLLPAQMAQGGGALQAADKAKGGASVQGGQSSQAGSTGRGLVLSGPTSAQEATPWALMISALVGIVIFYALAIRLWGVNPARLLASARRQAPPYSGDYSIPVAVKGGPPRGQGPMPHASSPRTLGTTPTASRREPNLLISAEAQYSLRINRAVELAWEERQGSSMSEFLMALRVAGSLDVAEVASAHQLNATAFLALSRAQLAAGHAADAHRTLTHGILVLPRERLLRMALNQLETTNCA